ncbi:metallophosphoesterase [Microcoleus sp. FACHB-831]|nr:metallophosphoesterase [Microcoleus sp. FACHB-831]
MNKIQQRSKLLRAVLIVLVSLTLITVPLTALPSMKSAGELLTDPFLQFPASNLVQVVWFTEFAGSRHTVAYGENLQQSAIATTTKLSRTREDQKSRVGKQTADAQVYKQTTMRDIWRHQATVTGLTPNTRVPYRVSSVREDGKTINSKQFTLAPTPAPGTPIQILLTSDHQLKPMTSANLQKAAESVGQVDAVLFAGDMVNVPDRASEWFDDNRGGALFPALQGRAKFELEKNGVGTIYKGGEFLQHAPMFATIGNHEVMGRFSMDSSLDDQFSDAFPRLDAQELKSTKTSVKDNSFNTDTYEEIFSLPQSNEGGKKYYAVTFGDVRLVVLYITNVWRPWGIDPKTKGKFSEREQDLNDPINWGYGQHIFEPIAKGSTQYKWLEEELNSQDFKESKYKIVMFHHPPHSLGENIVPAYTDPLQVRENNADGSIKAVRYEYPKQADYIIRDVVPLLETAGVQLVFYGHSHLWNRFISQKGMHFLETSNVGNSYGAFIGDKKRSLPSNFGSDYAVTGNPNGLEPIVPAIAPLVGEDGQPLPYVASNDITVFSILDTGAGTVSSYRFDTREPESQVVKFDEFRLRQHI